MKPSSTIVLLPGLISSFLSAEAQSAAPNYIWGGEGLPIWLMAMVAPPFISLAVPGPTGERVSRFASFAILSIVAIISGIAIGFFSALNGLVIGVLFAIWGMPLVVLSVAVATVVKNRREAEFRLARRAADRLVEDGVAKGYCPNCEKLIALSSNGCAFCGADFGPNSAWKIQPTK